MADIITIIDFIFDSAFQIFSLLMSYWPTAFGVIIAIIYLIVNLMLIIRGKDK